MYWNIATVNQRCKYTFLFKIINSVLLKELTNLDVLIKQDMLVCDFTINTIPARLTYCLHIEFNLVLKFEMLELNVPDNGVIIGHVLQTIFLSCICPPWLPMLVSSKLTELPGSAFMFYEMTSSGLSPICAILSGFGYILISHVILPLNCAQYTWSQLNGEIEMHF